MCPFHHAARNVLPVHANHMAMLEEIRLQFLFAIFYFACAKLSQVILWQRRSRRACSHGCCDFWQMNIQESLRLFQVNHCFNAHQSRLSCIMFGLHFVRPFCVQVLPDCQLMISRWQAWSAGNHLQSAELVCVPSTRQHESSYLDPSLRLDVPACCGTASCSQPQLAPSWFHLE